MKITASRLCPKSVTGMKVFQMRRKIKVKTIEKQRVSDLSETRHRNENIPNAVEKDCKNEGSQRVSDLSKKRHRNENIPNAEENKSEN